MTDIWVCTEHCDDETVTSKYFATPDLAWQFLALRVHQYARTSDPHQQRVREEGLLRLRQALLKMDYGAVAEDAFHILERLRQGTRITIERVPLHDQQYIQGDTKFARLPPCTACGKAWEQHSRGDAKCLFDAGHYT